MEIIDQTLVAELQRFLKRKVPVISGPPAIDTTAWLKPEIYVHCAGFTDCQGVIADGSQIARRELRLPPNYRGYDEARPGRIVVEVNCLSASYKIVQYLLSTTAAKTLLVLESLPDIPLSSMPDQRTQMVFREFTVHLHSATIMTEQHDKSAYHIGKLQYYLEGFLHVQVVKRGGLKKLTSSRKKKQTKTVRKKKNS